MPPGATLAAAAHQRQDAGAELLHADDEIVEGQHDAAHAGHGGQLVEHAGDRGVGADEHALIGRQLVDAEGPAPVRRCIGVLARVVLGLGVAPGQRLEVGAGLVVLPFRHRRGVGLVGDDHLQDQRAAIAAGLGRRLAPAARRSARRAVGSLTPTLPQKL